MKNFLLGMAALLLLSCSPKNEDVTMEQAAPAQAEEAVDSAANTTLDGTATAQTYDSPTTSIPQPAMQLLAQKYKGWEEPTLSKAALDSAAKHEQGPLIVRGDFNGDTLQDYAFQIQHKDNVVALATLQINGNWQMYELTRERLSNENGNLQSIYHLYLLKAGANLTDQSKTSNDAVAIGKGTTAVAFMFDNGKFRELRLK